MADEAQVPDLYIDQFRVTLGVFGVNMTFGLSEPHPITGGVPPATTDIVRLRMSLEHAKTVAMLLRKQLKMYEEQNGFDIKLPAGVYTSLGVAEEDWGL